MNNDKVTNNNKLPPSNGENSEDNELEKTTVLPKDLIAKSLIEKKTTPDEDETIILQQKKIGNIFDNEEGCTGSDDTLPISRDQLTSHQCTRKLYILRHGLVHAEYILNTNKRLIGRHPSNDIVLNHPKISRHHAEIIFESGKFKVINKGLNKILIKNKKTDEFTLENGDSFEITPFILQYVEL